MNLKQMFKKHYLRLVFEGVFKSVLVGLAIGFAANFLMALLGWVFSFGEIWLAIGIGAAVWVVSGVLLYFLKFKPSIEETAQRMDRLGLEERMITMIELKQDDSYIATVQRENAKKSIAHIEGRKIKIRIPRVVICLVVVAAVLGSSMTTVKSLADNGDIPSFEEIVEDDPYANYIPVTYTVDEGGYIEGETDQLVEPGASTTPVIAVAEDGWVFVGWDDGYTELERYESNVTQELYFKAIFEEIIDSEGGEAGDGDGNGEGGQKAEGDQAEDLPSNGGANAESDQSGAEGSEGDGSGSKGDSDGGQGSSDEQGEGKGDGKGQGAGGKWDDANKFLDGDQYYREWLDYYYQTALEIFEANGEIPPELREFFEAYYDSI